jgi:putative transferase (TIGR04331 family)
MSRLQTIDKETLPVILIFSLHMAYMANQSRYLITTADERTWKFNEPVIFLGEWCRRYERKHIWSEMNAILAGPYGLGQVQKDRDHAHAFSLREELIILLQQELNKYHGTDYSLRFWRILLGHWLFNYVNTVLNRYQTLRQCLEQYPVSGTTLLGSENYHLATQDSLSFLHASGDDTWNDVLISHILEFFDAPCLRIDRCPVEDSPYFRLRHSVDQNLSLKKRIKTWIRQVYYKVDSLTNFFVRDQGAFIINSYLTPMEEVQLHFLLGQVPKTWRVPHSDYYAEPNWKVRENLVQHFTTSKNGDKFSSCIYKLLFQVLPVCYLEGFSYLCAKSRELPWPKSPRFIFSSNIEAMELLQCWVAAKTENGSLYFIGQHGGGGNYWTLRNESGVQESTCNKYLSWGYLTEIQQCTPSFVFRTEGSERWSYDSQGRLLLIEYGFYPRVTTYDGHAEFETFFNEQKTFVGKLLPGCRDMLTIRLYPGCKSRDIRSQEARWHEFKANLKIDSGRVPVRKLIKASRLVVHSYDSTGISQTLSQNIPTMAFFQNGLAHVQHIAISDYELLVDVGIFHLSPESIAERINDVWNNIPNWWYSDRVQEARQKFCDRYARTSKRRVKDLKRTLDALTNE